MKVGGLGLGRLVPQNISFLMKLAYQLVTDLDSLWVRILRSKYKVDGIFPQSIYKSNSSYVWRSLSRIWERFMNNTYWSIGDGQTANFLYDCWIPEVGPLSNHVLDGSVLPAHLKVADLVDSDGLLELDCFAELFYQ